MDSFIVALCSWEGIENCIQETFAFRAKLLMQEKVHRPLKNQMLIQNVFNHIVKASGGYVFCLKSGILFFDGLIHISSDGFICLHIGDTNLRWHHALWSELHTFVQIL